MPLSNLVLTNALTSGGGITPFAQGRVEPYFTLSVAPRQFTGINCTAAWNPGDGVVTLTLDAIYDHALLLYWLTVDIFNPILIGAATANVEISDTVAPGFTSLRVSFPGGTRQAGLIVDPSLVYWPGFNFAIFLQTATPVDMSSAGPV